GAGGAIQPRYGFQVVIEHIRRLGGRDIQCDVHASAIIRHQGFQLDSRRQLADLPEAVSEVLSAAVTQVVTVYRGEDRKSTRLNSSHVKISYAVFCLKKKPTRSYWTL